MSIEQEKVVDIIGDDEKTNEVVLFVTDHLPWGSDASEHLHLLQNKLNSYLAFIESGELLKAHPSADKKRVVIEIRAKYKPDATANMFYDKAIKKAEEAGIGLRYVVTG